MSSTRIAGGWFFAMRRILATVCIGLLAVLIGYKVVFGANGMKVWEAKRAEVERLQQEIEAEKTTHEQLGFVKPGEHVLYEPPPKSDPKQPPSVAENESPK